MDTPLPPLPAPRDPAIQAALDADHLRLLEIGFYISGVLGVLRCLWFLLVGCFFAFGGMLAFLAKQAPPPNGPPPAFFFAIVGTVLGVMLLLSIIFTVLEFYAGVCLKNRRHPILIQVVAAFYCLSIQWGTALGVFTFMVLNRPTVQPLFPSSRA